jgi:hypothetical protein
MERQAQDLVAQLDQLGYRVSLFKKKPLRKPPACSICGALDQNATYRPEEFDLSDFDEETSEVAEWITRIKVEVGSTGGEGWDRQVLLLCEQHDQSVLDALIKLGFGTHHHGSTHPLADPSCPGDMRVELCPAAETDEHGHSYYKRPYDDFD